jgi:restriction system protein
VINYSIVAQGLWGRETACQVGLSGVYDLDKWRGAGMPNREVGKPAFRRVSVGRMSQETSPSRFESIVVELLVKMGYGGSLADAGQVIGRSHDSGIDGIIKEDKLGLDVIYIQAKRWKEGSVGSSEIMKFAGALAGQQANKGIFITTSTFTQEARSYVSKVGSKIVLIDGAQLANLMIDYEVGVSTQSFYPVKKLDQDYYEEG